MGKIKTLWSNFKNSPINAIADWQDARFLWLVMVFVSAALVILAHSFFQIYLYMAPCEQCVYIRFAFFCMIFGGLIAAINPKMIVLKIVGYILAFFGIIKGIGYSIKLNKIHEAVHGDDPFGVQGCSTEPTFPFGLPLEKWFPEWFLPTGDCGYDSPIIPDGASLNAFQEFMTNMYIESEGWYLIPQMHFMSMAQACFLAFGVCLAILSVMFISWIIRDFIKKPAK